MNTPTMKLRVAVSVLAMDRCIAPINKSVAVRSLASSFVNVPTKDNVPVTVRRCKTPPGI